MDKQRMLATGDPFESVQQVAQLAADLQAQPGITLNITARPILMPSHPAMQPSPPPDGPTETLTEQSFNTPGAVNSPTPRPTRTATPAPGEPFILDNQETLCKPDLQEGLLQVIVMDARHRQIPGAEVVVVWDAGEEHFFTGFKPELGNGYADFVMQTGMVYNIRVEEGGSPVSGVTPPSCTSEGGNSFSGSIRLTFKQD